MWTSEINLAEFSFSCRATSSRKEMVSRLTSGQLSVIKETSSTVLTPQEAKPCESGASPGTKASTQTTSRSLSRGRRPLTIPKEPNFHSIHVPKSCTRKGDSHQSWHFEGMISCCSIISLNCIFSFKFYCLLLLGIGSFHLSKCVYVVTFEIQKWLKYLIIYSFKKRGNLIDYFPTSMFLFWHISLNNIVNI